jgi:hypothetical protein
VSGYGFSLFNNTAFETLLLRVFKLSHNFVTKRIHLDFQVGNSVLHGIHVYNLLLGYKHFNKFWRNRCIAFQTFFIAVGQGRAMYKIRDPINFVPQGFLTKGVFVELIQTIGMDGALTKEAAKR